MNYIMAAGSCPGDGICTAEKGIASDLGKTTRQNMVKVLMQIGLGHASDSNAVA